MTPDTIELEQLNLFRRHGTYPDKTYKLDFVNKRIIGKIEGAEAVWQFLHKVFATDKYAYVIYDWYYGNELYTLIGMPYDYVVTDCPRIIREALLVDDRIISVENFSFSRVSVDSLSVSCTVNTIFGTINYSQEVPI